MTRVAYNIKTARHVRSDRLLHEATTTQDPVHLMRVFGVSAATAMRYLHAGRAARDGQERDHHTVRRP